MLLSVSNVAKAFGVDEILTGVSFQIAAREKVALVGRNGTGKTTLLRIVTGQMEPDSGTVNLARGAKIGYLRQEAPVGSGRTVLEEAQASMQHQLEMQKRLEELERKLADNPSESDLEEYALLHEHFLEAEGYSAERDIRVVLQRMGFTDDEFDKQTDNLSGGEKTRLAIARMLLEEPELLILDEPTNHLDLQATEWLEGWLRQYHGAVLLVSHDREFLDNTAERVLEMRDGTVKSYPGPFPKFLKLKEEEEIRLAEVAKRQEQEIAKLDEYVRRFMNSQRTAQARGRLKQMNRLIESKVDAPKKEKGMKAGFGGDKRSGDIVIETEKLAVGFPSQSPPTSNTLPAFPNAQHQTPNAASPNTPTPQHPNTRPASPNAQRPTPNASSPNTPTPQHPNTLPTPPNAQHPTPNPTSPNTPTPQHPNTRPASPNAKRQTPNAVPPPNPPILQSSNPLFPPLSWTVRYQDRWGVIGENGAGKSTLIKTILGLLEPLTGRRRLGSNLDVGYFSQDTQELSLDQSPLDFLVWECDMLPAEARNLLGRFLISGDDVYRPIRTLSGGEKNKLSLARLTNQQPNLLILDEPTNHLDMDSREALAKVLQEYKGTLVLISHDRWLLSQVTDHTLDVRKSGPILFNGSYPEYRPWQKRGATPQRPTPTAPQSANPQSSNPPILSPRELSKEIQRVAKLVSDIEDQVAAIEGKIKGVETILANLPPTADVLALTQEHHHLQESLEGAMATWEEQSSKLEQLQAMQG
ncbi:MAG TPA: ATP-binding cassette domain-containing protein [Fimbriimonadaceae bacterium]|nr:ATP-binding cassette domain-containing protein [Fimbriimonadaceae bacterium]